MTSKTLKTDVARAKAHYLSVLGVLPEPIRAMVDYAPEALVAYQQFKDYLYKPAGEAALDLKTKELIYVAISMSNQCDYCIASHLAGARGKGMTDEQLKELIAVVGFANANNRIVAGYQVEIDQRFR